LKNGTQKQEEHYHHRRNTITTGGTLLPHYFPALAATSDHRSMYLYGKKMCWTVTPSADCESRFFCAVV